MPHRPTAREIKAALDRQVETLKARGVEFGPGTWDVDMDGMSEDEVEAYAVLLFEDRLLPSDPRMVRRPHVDRSIVVRRA